MEAVALGIRRVGQIAITVHDVPRATAFYRDVLGLKHLFDVPNMSFFDCAGLRLMLAVAEPGEHDHPPSTLYFEVPDIVAAHEHLLARGVTVVQPPHFVADLGDRDLWLGFFRDSESNVMSLMSEIPKAAR